MEEAIPLLRHAARLAPDNASIRHNLGSALLDCEQIAEATDNLATAIRLDPRLARAHFCLGLAQSRQGWVTDAIGSFRRAVAIAPKLADAQLELGVLLQERHRDEQAAEAFDKAAAGAGGTATGREAAARALIARDQPEQAIALLQRARALDPKAVGVIHLLAHTLIAMGRMAEAEHALTEALAVNPRNVRAWYELTTLRKMTPSDRPLVGRMTALLRTGKFSLPEQALLHFALGKMHDDLREFEAAIGQYDAGNRIRARNSPLDRKMAVRTIDRHIELFPGGAIGTDDKSAPGDQRPVFIVGMPRSGTTPVEQILSSHPLVAAGGELGFWAEHGPAVVDEGVDALTGDGVQRLAREYAAVLGDISSNAARITDKNPFNFMHLGLVRRVFPRGSSSIAAGIRWTPAYRCISPISRPLAFRSWATARIWSSTIGNMSASCSIAARHCPPAGFWRSTTRRSSPTEKRRPGGSFHSASWSGTMPASGTRRTGVPPPLQASGRHGNRSIAVRWSDRAIMNHGSGNSPN
jgi:tetratricopeptide (TPR) repeat protein